MTNSKSPPNYGDSKLFYPETIIITPQARASPSALRFIDTVRNRAPDVNLVYSTDQRPPFPPGIDSSTKKYFFSRNTVTLSERTDQFIETFASPGHIIEEPGTVVKSVSQCPNSCEFCYLQRTALRQPWQRIYTNLQFLEREMLNETVLHPAWLSLLSIISFHEKKVLQKIPKGYKETADGLREKLSRKGRAVLTENQVKLYFRDNLKEILSAFGINCDSDNLKGYIAQFMEFYKINKSYPLWFNISEYSDIVSSNHLHHQLEMFFDIVDRNENVNIQFFTKSANMDSLLENFKGHNRIRIILNLSTEYVQERYEQGTSSLSERLRIAKKIQKSDGFRLVLHLEPIIKYPRYEEEYLSLIRTLMTKLDPKKLDGVTLGSIRYAGNLISVIKKNYPETDLFSEEQALVKPKAGFVDRYRYSLKERVKIYSLLIDEIRKHTDVPVKFGAETPELWLEMGFNSDEFLRKYFYQYPGNDDDKMNHLIIKRNDKLNENNRNEIKALAAMVLHQGVQPLDVAASFSLKYPEIDKESILAAIYEELYLLAEDEFSRAPLDKTLVRIIGNKVYYNIKSTSLDLYMDPESREVFLSLTELKDNPSPDESGVVKNQMDLLNLTSGRKSKAVLDLIEGFIRKYIRLKNEDHYTLLSVYTLLSYVYRGFQVIPYIKLKGEKGTGKTTVLSVLNCLMNNAKFASNISPSGLYRIMDDGDCTLLIDEAENLRARKSSTEAFFEILNSGYHSSGTVIRTIEGVVTEFSTFGPKVIASINDLAPATEDRTIIVETDQDKDNGTLESFNKEAALEEIQAIKTAIFSAVPDLLKRIPEEIKAFSSGESNEFGIDLKNRHKDRWISILILTKILSRGKKKLIKAAIKAAKADLELKNLADKMSPEKIALEVLSDVVKDENTRVIGSSANYICIEARTISEAIIKSDVQRYFTNQGQVTSFLKSRGVIVDRRRVDHDLTILYKIPVHLTNLS